METSYQMSYVMLYIMSSYNFMYHKSVSCDVIYHTISHHIWYCVMLYISNHVMSYVISHVTYHISHIIYHISHITYHISHITYHISQIRTLTCLFSQCSPVKHGRRHTVELTVVSEKKPVFLRWATVYSCELCWLVLCCVVLTSADVTQTDRCFCLRREEDSFSSAMLASLS